MLPIWQRLVPVIVVLLLSACAHRPSGAGGTAGPPASLPPGLASQYGVVSAIETIRQPRSGLGAGAVVGGVVGAVVGRELGGAGDARTAATIGGAVAGAVIGHEIERQQGSGRSALRVSVRLDRGGVRHFEFARVDDLRVGDRVRVQGDQLQRL